MSRAGPLPMFLVVMRCTGIGYSEDWAGSVWSARRSKCPRSCPPTWWPMKSTVGWTGERIYLATTAGEEWILGASVAASASEAALTQAYRVFADEAKAVDPDLHPRRSTPMVGLPPKGEALFPTITVILCFLHAFLKIRDRATKALAEVFEQAREKVWQASRAHNKAAFAQRLRRLREWATQTLPDSPMKNHTLDLCAKRAPFSRCYDHQRAHRTSNMVDRLMKFLDRACFNGETHSE